MDQYVLMLHHLVAIHVSSPMPIDLKVCTIPITSNDLGAFHKMPPPKSIQFCAKYKCKRPNAPEAIVNTSSTREAPKNPKYIGPGASAQAYQHTSSWCFLRHMRTIPKGSIVHLLPRSWSLHLARRPRGHVTSLGEKPRPLGRHLIGRRGLMTP